MKHLANPLLAVAFGGLIAYGAFSNVACDDNNDTITVTTGSGGRGGTIGGLAGGSAGPTILTYAVTMNAANEIPSNPSTAAGTATLDLVRRPARLSVTGSYTDLTSVATEAHIHGPAGTTASAPVIVPLDVSGGLSGTIAGGARSARRR